MKQMSKIELNDFKKAFKLFDKDNSGSISRQEIAQVFKEMKINLKQIELQKIMQNFDANHDNSIQFDEFLLVLSAHLQEPQSQQWIFEVFQIIDQDCDGLIHKDQLIKVNQCFELGIDEKHIDLIIQQADPYQQGGITYQQFTRIIKGK